MEKKIINTQFNNISVFDTDFRNSVQPYNIFGLGKSHYSPGTSTTTVKIFNPKVEGKITGGGDIVMPYLSPIYTHEMGHSVFTGFSTGGKALQRVIALRNGLCFIILNKMIQKHGRIWISVFKYFEEKLQDPEINKLLKILKRILSLELKLFDGWKIGQELVAFGTLMMLTGEVERYTSEIFHTDERLAMAESWHLFASFGDDEIVLRVVRKLKQYCDRNSIEWSSISIDVFFQFLDKVDEIFQEDKEAKGYFIGWLDVMPKFKDYYSNDKSKDASERYKSKDEIHAKLKKEIRDLYESSGHEHLEAMKLITEAKDSSEIFGLVMQFVSSALFFAPQLPPKKLFEETIDLDSFGSLDAASLELKDTIAYIQRKLNLTHPSEIMNILFDDKSVGKILINRVIEIQKKINWVPLDNKKVKNYNICGSKEWIQKSIKLITPNKKDRLLLQHLIESYNTFVVKKNEIKFQEFCDFLSLLPNRIIFQLIWYIYKIIARRIIKENPQLDNIYSILRELKIKSAKDIVNFLKRYISSIYSFINQINDKDESNFPFQSSTIYYDEDGLKLLIPEEIESFLNHGQRIYLFGKLCDLSIQEISNDTLLLGRM